MALSSLESAVLLLYPTILILGSIFSLIDPAARNAPYDAERQSHPPEFAPSYFALKKNIVNTYFVKVNWFWVTSAYLVFLFVNEATRPSGPYLNGQRIRGLARYALVTIWWACITQWFFGPPIIDRGFRLTGGACELAREFADTGGAKELVTGQACKIAGGVWKGGHDISGHVFILVLGSAFLLLEALPVLVRQRGLQDDRVIVEQNGNIQLVEQDESDVTTTPVHHSVSISWAPLLVATLDCFMLFMTAAYFHTWFEKVSLIRGMSWC